MAENDIHEVAARFGGSALTYDDVATVQARLADELAEAAAPHIAPEGHLLDIGCGTGHLARRLAALVRPIRISLFDVSREMLRVAAPKVAAECNVLVDCYDGDAETLPWPTADAVVSSSAVQWFARPLDFVTKARQALDEGGTFALATYGPATFAELRGGASSSYPSLADWTKALTDAGFQMVSSRRSVEKQSFESRVRMLRMISLCGIGTNRIGQSTEAMNGDWTLTWETISIVAKL